jgi:peroxiredoxin/predicted 2-oxoglutarate/Fe(II)-dependent dioxygenase YbiX
MVLSFGPRSQGFERVQQTVLSVGDIVPPIRLISHDGKPIALESDDVSGNYLLLLVLDAPMTPSARALLDRSKQIMADAASAGCKIFAVTPLKSQDNAALARDLELPFPLLSDPERAIFALFGAASERSPVMVVVRPNHHVMALLTGSEAEQPENAIAVIRRDADNRRSRQVERHPPVLIVPDVLSRKDCEHLITVFTLQGNVWVEPGHGTQNMTSDYKMRIPDYGRRDRVDHWVINQATTRFIVERLSARLFPEIEKAFQYRVTRFERFRIGCYEGERGGEAHGHRDNTTAMVAHRRFACSINLNSENFEGGELRFPEYGGHLYRPESGSAIAFSSSLLHEPLPVTAGRRYVLLAFLFGES